MQMCNLYSGMSQQFEMKPSSESYRLAEIAAIEELHSERENDTLKQSWLKLATQLETENIPKHKISTIGKKIIIEKKKDQLQKLNIPQQQLDQVTISGWWGEVMSENGYTDPKFDSTEATEPSPNNSSINTLNNNNMILICDDVMNICRYIKEKAKGAKPLEDIFGEKEMKEFYKQRKDMMKNCKNVIDEKTKVPKNTELFLLESLATVLGNTNRCAEVFQQVNMKHMKEQGKFLTLKQANKFQNGDKQSQLLILKPTSRDTALYGGYTGIQCTCESWRVRVQSNSNSLECYDCERVFPKQYIPKCTNCQIPLFTERIKHIEKTGKCENCNCEVDLPEEILQYANTSF